MAMSRTLARASLRPPSALIIHHRHRSNKPHHAQLIELDLDPSSSSQTNSPEAAAEVITLGIKKLEDAIHSIIVRRAAPDWLPFLPGYSYWVPPRSSSMRSHSASSMMEVIGSFSSVRPKNLRASSFDVLSGDEQMSYGSAKGWPSSAFFIEEILNNGMALSLKVKQVIMLRFDNCFWYQRGTSPIHPIPVVEVTVKIQDNEDNVDDTCNSEDEEE